MSKLSEMQFKRNNVQSDLDDSHLALGEATRQLESTLVKVELDESKASDVTKCRAALTRADRAKADLEQQLRILTAAIKIQRKRENEQKAADDKIRQSLLQAAAAAQMDELRLEATVALAKVVEASAALSESPGFDHTRIGDFCIRGPDSMPNFSEAFDNARHAWADAATSTDQKIKAVA